MMDSPDESSHLFKYHIGESRFSSSAVACPGSGWPEVAQEQKEQHRLPQAEKSYRRG